MANLRILVVRAPVGTHRGYWNATLEYNHARYGRLDLPIPKPKDPMKAWAERHALSKQSLQNLRFVVIYNHYFWIEHFDVYGHYARFWKLEDALGDYWQRVKMKFLLHDEDWAFLRDKAGIVGEHMSDDEYRRGNRLVVFREELGGFNDSEWEHDTRIGFPPNTVKINAKDIDSWRKVLKRKRDLDEEINAGYFIKVHKPDGWSP